MLLYIITIFIFISISYKKVKNNLFNISKILNKIEPIKNHPIIKGNKKFIEKKIKNNKIGKNIKLKNRDNSANRINIHKINSNKSFENNHKQMKKRINGIKDCEYNSLEYEEAFKSDKRNYFQYYISLLKYNHPFIYSFCTRSDYNSRIIKIFLFFFSFSSDLTINALFFNDDTMHKLYKDRGKFDLLFQIPQILYSTLISKLIDALIKTLALSQDNIIELKKEKEKEKEKYNIKKKISKTLNILRIKFSLFFVFSFIILSSFWYYITCFCGVYVNTQINLIKDSIISLIISLIYPFVIYLIPGIFRIPSLRMKKNSGRYLYKFSSFLENYLT